MRGNGRWVSVGAIAIVTAFVACGGDDDAPGTASDAGTDARDAGRGGSGGAAGSDAGRIDTSAGSGGVGGTAGTAGSGGNAGIGGALDVRTDVPIDTSAPDAPTDRGPIVDALVDADGPSADGAMDGDAATPDTWNDASDASPPDADAATPSDANDAAPVDVSGDASDGDAQSDATDAAEGAADVYDAPSCNDNNPATFDFYSPFYGCGHKYDANPNDGDAWITYSAGFHVDVATGLGWVTPPGSRSASAAAIECDGYSVAGLTDWRMPTITEIRTLAGGCAPTASGGTCPLADPGCLDTTCGIQSPACDSCTGGQGPNQFQYCKVDVQICSHFHTSSPCTDCGDAGGFNWIYGPSNGNFLPFGSGLGIPTACVSVVPNGVPPSDGG